MNILLINPFHTGSHANWVNGLVKYLPEIRNDHLPAGLFPVNIGSGGCTALEGTSQTELEV